MGNTTRKTDVSPEVRKKIEEHADGLQTVAQDGGPFSAYAQQLLELIEEGERQTNR